jgi:hypothetical protein
MDLESAVVEQKTVFDLIGGVAVHSWPLTIMATAQVEGVDTPFFTMFNTAKDPSTLSHTKLRGARVRSLLSGIYGQGITTPIFDAPPDTTPMFVGKLYEIPSRNYAKRQRDRAVLAKEATSSAPGYSSDLTPASTYSDLSCRLLSEIQRHMLESTIDGGATWSLWTEAEVLGYLNQRIVRFLMETGLIQVRTTRAVANGISEVSLPTDKIDLRRVAWDTGSSISSLTRIDTIALDYGTVGWQSGTGTPYAYVEEPLDPLTIQLVSTPSASGTVDLIYVQAPSAIGSTCVPIPLPSFLTPYVKYGVMADMFMKQGEANDPERAEYCESRFKEGVEASRSFLGVK